MNRLLPYITEKDNRILRDIMEDFACATDLGAVIVDIRGTESSDFYNFSPFCQTMRKYPEFGKLCRKCSMHGGLESSKAGRPYLYRCHAGLTDVSLPLIVQNSLLGFLLLGQSDVGSIHNNETPMIQEVESNWSDFKELREKRESVINFPPERILSAARLLEKICKEHSEKLEPKERISIPQKSKTQKLLQPNEKEEIQKAMFYIQKNVTKPITLQNVAEHVFLSENYFSRLFKKEVGVSFVTYLNQQRIDRAKALLKTSELSVDTIAHNVGFTHTSYFCKIFKHFAQTTPEKYRKRYRL